MTLRYPDLDPVAVRLGPLAIRWYGLAYITGLVLGWRYTVWLSGQKRFNGPSSRPTAIDLDDFLFWAMAGVLIGGRLGIVLFYQPHAYFADPISILKIWEGGMSFHGGMLGVASALFLFTRQRQIPLFHISDLVACAAPIGLFFGRLANFVNGELWGRVTDSPLGMVFPTGGPQPRHPSQLYEAGLEGLALALVLIPLFWKTNARFRPGLLAGMFPLGFGMARFVVEFYREPDAQLAEFARNTGLSMGQWLTLPMIAVGAFFVIRALRRPPLGAVATPA